MLLQQKRFTYLPGEDDQEWLIPLSVRLFFRDGHVETISDLMEGKSKAIEIDGKVAIVTGAARGIGRATALALAHAGAAAVVAADANLEGAKETAEAIGRAGCEGVALQTDVADLDSVSAMIDAAVSKFGALHILHNNAGIGEGTWNWPAVPPDRAAAIVDDTAGNNSRALFLLFIQRSAR